jgi:hypothetical protein
VGAGIGSIRFWPGFMGSIWGLDGWRSRSWNWTKV